MASGPKIVHKQFNSPMGLYSQQNIKETLNKHMKNLDNGTVGIDFNNTDADKPANLANSAVLRMLEEEERSRRGLPSQKKVVWPPVPETNGYHQTKQQAPAYNAQYPSQQQYNQPQEQYNAPAQHYNAPNQQYNTPQQNTPKEYIVPIQQYNAPNQQYNAPNQQYNAPNQQKSAPKEYIVPIQQYNAPAQQYNAPSQQYSPSYQDQSQQYQPSYCEGRRQEPTGLSKLIPVGPGVTVSPAQHSPNVGRQPQRQAPQSPNVGRQPQSQRWAPVPTPVSPQAYGSQPSYPAQTFSPPPQYTQDAYQSQQKPFEPPATTITLRPQPPIHQKPSPVFASQPAAASFQGGVNMRGDMKWPPQSVKEAVEAENEARRQLARGPACRPRKVKKDYTEFFAKNALNNNYPGYRVPPGTQHFEDHSGQSSY